MCDCKIKCALAEHSDRQGSAKQVLISGSTLFKTRNNVLSSLQGGDLQSKYYRDLTGCLAERCKAPRTPRLFAQQVFSYLCQIH